MDEITIRSKIMKKIIASLIARSIRQKFGFTPEILFKDQITVDMDEEDVIVGIHADLICKSKDLEKLLGV